MIGEVIYRKISEIKPLQNNPRRINDRQFGILCNSIQTLPDYFEARPILLSDRTGELVIIAGNMRYHAAKKIGLETVPTYIIKDLTEEKEKEIVIRDNVQNGEWDFDMLANEWDAGMLEGWGLDIPAFDPNEKEIPDEAEDDHYEIPDEVKTDIKEGDLFEISIKGLKHRIMCGDSTKAEHVALLMGERLADALITDPPYNVDYQGGTAAKLKIENDKMTDAKFKAFLTDAFKQAASAIKAGAAYYVYHASRESVNFIEALRANGMTDKQQLIWVKSSLVLGRQDYQWRHEPCQLPGTSVVMEGGQTKPIEQITENERVVGLERASLQLTGWNKSGTGKKVKGTASRQYEGNIYHISVGEAETNATDNHKFTVRYNKAEAEKYFVYLMKKGERWRVGISQLRNSRGSGMRDRLRGEKADALWIVSQGYENKIDAQIQETIIGLKYRIPQTVWNTGKPGRICAKNDDQISRIYDEIGVQVIDKGARELLGDRINHPQIIRNKGKESTTSGFTVEACNLMPKVYEVLMPHKIATGTIVAQYQQITGIRTEEYQGPVYSLSVEGQHYISDGIVTHNCLYGWKEGAAHYFINNRSLTTVIEDEIDVEKMSKQQMKEMLSEMLSEIIPSTVIREDKPLRNGEHPTMKPVKLIGRNISNSTRPYDLVLDLFGGSGSTLIASHQLMRNCYTSELDPKYAQVIIDRFKKLEPEARITKLNK